MRSYMSMSLLVIRGDLAEMTGRFKSPYRQFRDTPYTRRLIESQLGFEATRDICGLPNNKKGKF